MKSYRQYARLLKDEWLRCRPYEGVAATSTITSSTPLSNTSSQHSESICHVAAWLHLMRWHAGTPPPSSTSSSTSTSTSTNLHANANATPTTTLETQSWDDYFLENRSKVIKGKHPQFRKTSVYVYFTKACLAYHFLVVKDRRVCHW